MSTWSDKHGADKGGPDKGGPDKDLPDEQQLEEYLRGGSDVSRQYRQLRSADVPAELDRLVLRQAEEAVKARPAKSRTWMRWAGPLALAASAVLVLSIVIESGVHEEAYLTVPASAPVEVTAKQEAAEQPAVRNEAAAGSADDSSVVHIMPVSPTAIPEMAILEAPEPDLAVDAPAPFQDQAVAPVAPPPASAAQQFATVQPPTKLEKPPAELARRDQADVVVQSTRMAAPAPQASVVPPLELREEDSDLQQVVITGNRRREQKQTAGPRNTVAAPAANDQQEDEPSNYSDPEQWLRDIRVLRKENKHEEADREWRRFRYVFPNYQVAETDPARGALR